MTIMNERYGALNATGTGGIAVLGTSIVSGDPLGHWQISSGKLSVTSAGMGSLVGPYSLTLNNGDRVNIEIDANAWDVSTQAEWDGVITKSDSELFKKTIYIRAGVKLVTGVDGSTTLPTRLRRADFGGLVIEGREPLGSPNMAMIDRMKLHGTRNVTLRRLKTTPVAEDKIWLSGHGQAPNIFYVDGILIDQCHLSGQVADPFGDYSVTSYPNENVRLITTIGSVANSVGSITVTDCVIEHTGVGISVVSNRAGGQINVLRNEVRFFYSDGITIIHAQVMNNAARVDDNYVHGAIGLADDAALPHTDAIRFLSTTLATSDWTVSASRNVCIPGASRGGRLCQGLFAAGFVSSKANSGHFFIAKAIGNLVVTDVANAVAFPEAKDSVILNNTAVSFSAATNLPSVNLATASKAGTHRFERNVADLLQFSGSGSSLNNLAVGKRGSIYSYASLFEGSGFSPASRAEALTMFSRAVGGLLDPSNGHPIGAVARGPVSFPDKVPNGGSGVNLVA